VSFAWKCNCEVQQDALCGKHRDFLQVTAGGTYIYLVTTAILNTEHTINASEQRAEENLRDMRKNTVTVGRQIICTFHIVLLLGDI
jgi:hypothetical protein